MDLLIELRSRGHFAMPDDQPSIQFPGLVRQNYGMLQELTDQIRVLTVNLMRHVVTIWYLPRPKLVRAPA